MSAHDALRLQLVVGVIDAWIWGSIVWAVGVSWVGALEPLCGTVGWLGCLLLPFGFVEITLALHGLRGSDPAAWARRLARLQLLGGLLGSLPAVATGLFVIRRLDDGPRR